ncbi:sialate O-acetylesterase [Opitutus sp. ER46]|uniref:sialate O-acetylesterase n=1 Tax=Opitutus sp. ER46 TaxID=2161864 RepID=UPI000D301743|nr:sialate O-acetylesterase [Opitutus sp. ER46]PTX99084.1 sialate O-acetylesterase [Opitutus sp. ER46]
MRASGFLGLLLFTYLAVAVRAEVRCAAVFGDHMVLQRDRPVAIWGEAAPAEAVTVEFAGQTRATTADAGGHWRVQLPAMPASAEPRTLTLRGTNTMTLTDVLVGEVWLCSGQSNMEKQLGPRGGQKPTDNYEAEIGAADHPLLRLYQMPKHGRPQKKVLGFTWVVCTPESVVRTEFSAAGYYFGRELVRELGVPVGVINASYGGTQIETWLPEGAFARSDALRELRHVTYKTWVKGLQATELFQSMITPLVPYTLRGFLWYQGESNLMQSEGAIYTEKMRALVETWREAWGQPEAPWYYVQLAPFTYSQWTSFPRHQTPEALPVFWEAQRAALSVPHTGMVVTTDLVADVRDIHPTNKRDVGLRLAGLALAETYGRERLARSPQFRALERRADGRLEVRFADAGTGLRTRDGRPVSDFLVAGSDQRFVPAMAEIEGDRVIVSCPEIKDPVAVRFAWRETATPNLVNSAGLPAMPFRTDTWPVVSDAPKPPAEPKAPTPAPTADHGKSGAVRQ